MNSPAAIRNSIARRRSAVPLLHTIRCSLVVLALGLTNHAWADDANLSVVGPTGRSSVALFAYFSKYRNDQIFRPTGDRAGDYRQSRSDFEFSGIYAVNPRLSVSGAVIWRPTEHATLNWFGSAATASQSATFRSVEASALLVGEQTEPGFKLVANAGLGRSDLSGSTTVYIASVQPQYRFDDRTLLSLRVGANHSESSADSRTVSASLIWSPIPRLALVPSVGQRHIDAANTYAPYRETFAGLSATYHLTPQWSLSAGATRLTQSKRTTDFYLNDTENGRQWSLMAGVRRTFD